MPGIFLPGKNVTCINFEHSLDTYWVSTSEGVGWGNKALVSIDMAIFSIVFQQVMSIEEI